MIKPNLTWLKKSIAPLMLTCFVGSAAFAGNTLPQANVSIYTTKGDRSLDLKKTNQKASAKVSANATTIELDAKVRFQEIDGFGAAVTGSTCYNLMQMNKADRLRFLKETFDPINGFGHSYIRISIGCSDFSMSEYTCCDEEGLEHFALQDEEHNYVIPILKEILKINPSIKILGSPWTPPRWMKVNNLTDLQPFNSWTSGQLNPKYYEDYGTYFVKWIHAFEKEGLKIYAITPQNEPLNRGNSASLFMGWQEQLNFVKAGLGPKLAAAGLKTKVYAFDHNYNYDNMKDQQQYPLHIYEDSEAAKYFTGAAYHNYGGNRRELLKIHEARPDKELIFTESSIGTWNKGQDLTIRLVEDMQELGTGTLNNWCKGVMVWNLMLDADRGPWREEGCKTCYGAVDIAKDFKTITRNSHYYVISHLAAVVKPGAVRIGTTKNADDAIDYTGFENKDGSRALVLVNKDTKAREIAVSDGRKQFTYAVPARAVVSFKWN